jgi:GNAT superfamily N-acetyltransferase
VHPIHDWTAAVAFAADHHADAMRKGTRVPYLTHVMAVADTLAYHYPERDALIVAGLLHDVVEDTGATLEHVRASFGPVVARLVEAVSKDDAAMERRLGTTVDELLTGLDEDEAVRVLWRARREFLLHHLRGPDTDPDVLRLKAADAHANLSAIHRDLRDPRVGERAWERFKVGRRDSLWYYDEVAQAVRAGIGAEPLAEALQAVLAAVAAEPPHASAPPDAHPSGRARDTPGATATVRRGTLADVDLVAPLFDAYRQFYGLPPDPELARRFLAERLARGESIVLLAEAAGGACHGFVQLFPSHSSVGAERIFVLNDLFVTPEARGEGVGRKLMQAATDTAREEGAGRLKLATATTNHRAQMLYESLGWRRVDDFYVYDLALARS